MHVHYYFFTEALSWSKGLFISPVNRENTAFLQSDIIFVIVPLIELGLQPS